MTYIIAEIGQTHEGSMGNAVALAVAAARAGVDAVKFQHHCPEFESTYEEPLRDGVDWYDDSRKDYWERTRFYDWDEICRNIRDNTAVHIGFSVFSAEGLYEVSSLADFLKIPSGEFDNQALIENMTMAGLPIYASLGMAPSSVEMPADIRLGLCVSKYPSSLENVRINRYLGLSDHSGSIHPGLVAISVGCPWLEVHACFSRDQYGPDVESSLTMEEIKLLCDHRDACKKIGRKKISDEEKAEMHRAYLRGKQRSCAAALS